MGSILPQIQCHFIFGMTLYTQCNKSAITMKTCHLFANTLTAFAFTWQPAGAIQAQFAVALTLTPTQYIQQAVVGIRGDQSTSNPQRPLYRPIRPADEIYNAKL